MTHTHQTIGKLDYFAQEGSGVGVPFTEGLSSVLGSCSHSAQAHLGASVQYSDPIYAIQIPSIVHMCAHAQTHATTDTTITPPHLFPTKSLCSVQLFSLEKQVAYLANKPNPLGFSGSKNNKRQPGSERPGAVHLPLVRSVQPGKEQNLYHGLRYFFS